MPDTIRRSGGSARPRQGGFRAASVLAAGAMALPSGSLAPAHAEELPLFDLHYLALDASHGFGGHELAILVPMLGLVVFASVTAVMLMRTRARATRVESVSRDEIAGLRDRLDRAQALLLSERQVIIDWPAIPTSWASASRIACWRSAVGSMPPKRPRWSMRSKRCA